jgi:uncharacterized protein (DUF2336 family)
MLRQVTDLFLSNVDRLRESQIGAFDGLLVPLVERTDARALVHLSEALSRIVVHQARQSASSRITIYPLVAVPVLQNSNRLSEQDLVEIAKTCSQQHLLAICGRRIIKH